MTATLRHVEHSYRCTCGTLLGVHREGAVHLKYKQFTAVVRGVVDVPCRRCGAVVTLRTNG